jgi:serine/threonine protein kinase
VVQPLQAGDPPRVGPYRLVGRLGSGGMGRVFLGRSAGGRLVAVKIIRAELAEDPEFRARFEREVAAARMVNGLFTALVVDAGLDGTMPWMATAYVAGPSLATAVSGHGPLPVASVLTLAAGLAEGLNAIHAAGVVHRDLKPSNVLLAEDGPRVIDFGISRAAEASVLTHTGLVVGSPGFMSPEQAEGREVGPPSDVFSLGAVLTFAATGEGPFGTGSTAALVYRVVHTPPSLDHVPAQVRFLVERCMAKEASQRPSTGELLAELDASDLAAGWLPAQIIQGFPQYSLPGLPPAGAGDAGSSPARVPTERSATPSKLSDAPGGPATVTVAKRHQPQTSAPAQTPLGRPDRRPRRRRRMMAVLVASVVALGAVAVTILLEQRTPAVSGSAASLPATWTPATATLPADASAAHPHAYLAAVTCPAAGSCTAVGGYTAEVGSTGLIETLSHGTWAPGEAPLPANAETASQHADLTAVACPAVASCIAVGGYSGHDGDYPGLIETLSHGTWTPGEAPLPANARIASLYATLNAVACSAVGSCVAIGFYTPNPGGSLGLTEVLSHGTWTPAELPMPADASASPYLDLTAVTCPAVASCVAVGFYSRDGGSLQGVIETFSDGTWTPGEAPLPADAAANPDAYLNGVVCPAPGACVASGYYTSEHGGSRGLVETLSDGTWTPATARLPADAAASQTSQGQMIGLFAIACGAPGKCVATGNYVARDEGVQGLIETLSDGTWTPAAAPLPVGAEAAHQFAALLGVWCPAGGSCIAVGGYNRGNGATQVLIETPMPARSK